jgi:hypothetical protein
VIRTHILLNSPFLVLTVNRGPAKGYTEALESRLCDTEEVLSSLLSYLSADDVSEALFRSSVDSTSSSRSYSGDLLADRKEAVKIWTKFPLKTDGDVQRWHNARRKPEQPISAPVQGSRIVCDTQAAAEFENIPESAGHDEGQGPVEEEEQIGKDDVVSTRIVEPGSDVDVRGRWEGATEQNQSHVNRSLGLSREFQENFLW